MLKPAYFGDIQERASRRWDQLEEDLELAGPWRQLFRQVQSPRHVVSELLQNADDAGATEAAAEIRDGEFVFSHNGEDFDKEQFASLCRFGFSNKRTLHTIGFRGIGFKSTFSLGEEVRVATPTLSVAFHSKRFTEPKWIEPFSVTNGRTEVHVKLQTERRQQELYRNLQEWKTSPASLLFFTNIRCLRVGEQEIRWESRGDGPVEGSEWMSVSTNPHKQYLIIRSEEENFPEEAMREIREERMADDDVSFPPSRIEIVLGMEGRLFVILPTGVTTQLPFACNAPFIQDPARMKIKDVAMSPTNAWLLRRAGELAADTMLAWVGRTDLSAEERCQAYQLLPDVDRDDNSIEGSCGSIVERAFEEKLDGQAFLLTETNTLEGPGECLSVPKELLEVWTPAQLSAEFGGQCLSILSRYVREQDRIKFVNWELIKRLDRMTILETLRNNNLPRPRNWQGMFQLWTYVSAEIATRWSLYRNIRIVPAQGEQLLYSADEIVRLGERRNFTEKDSEFLSPYLSVLDQDWIRFLTAQRRALEIGNQDHLRQQINKVDAMLQIFGLSEASDAGRVLKQVSDSFFSRRTTKNLNDCVRLAHIAAKLGAAVPDSFQYVAQDGTIRQGKKATIIADVDGDLDRFTQDDWYDSNVLHEAYARPSESCTAAEWRQWVQLPASGLDTFIPVNSTRSSITGRGRMGNALRNKGVEEELYFHYKRDNFRIEDWDFAELHWSHWNLLARTDELFWGRLLTRILNQVQSYWSTAKSARALQLATNGNTRLVTTSSLTPEWVMRFRELPCIPDNYGRPRHPSELLLRTPETEALLGVEPFVNADLDTETNRGVLESLGVGNRPTGPERLLDRLRALAGSINPLVPEVQRWCHFLDQLFDRCSTEEMLQIKAAFSDERLVLTDKEDWATPAEVFLSQGEDGVPGTALIHPSLRELALWRKLGVSERPTAELAIEWLKSLPSDQRLNAGEVERIRPFLRSYHGRIWEECGHWLNLSSEWVPAGSLAYSVTMQSLTQWSHLFPGARSKVADFRGLSLEVSQSLPFSALPKLGDVIEERFRGQSGLPNAQRKEWLVALGNGLRRIELNDTEQTEEVRTLGNRLAGTLWQVSGRLESVPYIGGIPVGASRPLDALWNDKHLLVREGSAAKLATKVPQEISRPFDRQDIADAVNLCYERSPSFIHEYLEEVFELVPEEDIKPADQAAAQAAVESRSDGTEFQLDEQSAMEDEDTEPTDAMDKDGMNGEENPAIPDAYDESSRNDNEQQNRPAHHSVLERFAQGRGFRKNDSGQFCHADGRWIGRASRSVFPWQLVSPAGDVLQYYWHKEHCIQLEPLQLAVDVWNLCQRSPDLHTLILIDLNDAPIEISGSRLAEMQQQDELALYPATYRLVYQGKDS